MPPRGTIRCSTVGVVIGQLDDGKVQHRWCSYWSDQGKATDYSSMLFRGTFRYNIVGVVVGQISTVVVVVWIYFLNKLPISHDGDRANSVWSC